MQIQNPATDELLTKRELVSTSKRLIEPYESAYHWIRGSGVRLHPDETVCTIVFASKGDKLVKHLTWQEIVSLHDAHDRILELEARIDRFPN